MDIPLGPTGCLIAAVITTLLSMWFAVAVLSDRVRSMWPRSSKVNTGAWAVYTALWAFAMFAEAFSWTAIRTPSLLVAILGFSVIIAGRYVDSKRNHKNA
jgi:hypothetical protein